MLQYATSVETIIPAFAATAPMSPAILDAQWRALPLWHRLRGWLRFHWERHDMGGKLTLVGCALGGGILGLVLAQLEEFDGSDLSNIIFVIFLGGMTFALISALNDDSSSHGPAASNAMILAAMRRTLRLFGEEALCALHASISTSVRKSHMPLDRSSLIFAYRRVARDYAPRRLRRIARRAKRLREQQSLLLAETSEQTVMKGGV